MRYSITWSARPSTDCGMVSPSAFAVLRLITSSNFVGCSIGKSAGLAPLEDLVHVARGAFHESVKIRPVAQEATGAYPRSPTSDAGYPLLVDKLQEAGTAEVHESRGDDHKRVGTCACSRLKGSVEVLGSSGFERLNVDAEATRGRLDVAILRIAMVGVPEHRDACQGWHRLFQELQPLAGRLRANERDACQVGAGPGEAGDHPRLDGVLTGEHHDRNRARRILHERHHVSSENHDHIGLQRYDLDSKFADSFRAALGTAIFEREVPALDITQIAQTRDKGGQIGIGGGRTEEKHAEPRDFARLLRFGGERRENETDCENDREPDQPHGHLGMGRLPGSLAEGDDAHQHSAYAGASSVTRSRRPRRSVTG